MPNVDILDLNKQELRKYRLQLLEQMAEIKAHKEELFQLQPKIKVKSLIDFAAQTLEDLAFQVRLIGSCNSMEEFRFKLNEMREKGCLNREVKERHKVIKD